MTKKDKKLLSFSFSGTALTGSLIYVLANFFRVEGDFGLENHPLLDEVKLIHNFFNTFFIFVLGTVWKNHIMLGLKGQKKSLTGKVLVYGILVLIISGLLLLSSFSFRGDLKDPHFYLGAFLFILFWLHQKLNTNT